MSDSIELSDVELQLYARQILLDQWDIDAQERLKLSNVLIIGCGGIGCLTAELLGRAGVGKLTLIDADIVEMSNLQRQIAFDHRDIGFYKAEVLAKKISQINPYIDIEYITSKIDLSNASTLITQQDLVLDGCDNFETRYLVNKICKKLNVPLISASAIGLQGQLFMVESDSACYECLFPKEDSTNESLRCADSGVLATTPNVMASLQAHHALLYLGLNLKPLREKLLLWNGLNMSQRIVHFQTDDDCQICHTSQSENLI